MSADRLQILERRWRESGAAEDEATFLLERLRSGDLSREGLELAAYLGSAGAQLAASGAAAASGPHQDIRKWLQGAPRNQLRCLWRGALVALDRTEGHCVHGLSGHFLNRMPLEEIRAAAMLWAQTPEAADQRGRSAVSLIPLAYNLIGGAIPILGEEALREHIRAELLSWVLGDRDPVVVRSGGEAQ